MIPAHAALRVLKIGKDCKCCDIAPWFIKFKVEYGPLKKQTYHLYKESQGKKWDYKENTVGAYAKTHGFPYIPEEKWHIYPDQLNHEIGPWVQLPCKQEGEQFEIRLDYHQPNLSTISDGDLILVWSSGVDY